MKTMKKIFERISNTLYALRGGKFIRMRSADDELTELQQLIDDFAWCFLRKAYPDDWRPVNSKLHLVDTILDKDMPYIHISLSKLTSHPYVTYHGTPEQLQLLQTQEYDVLDDTEDDAI